MIIRHKAKEYIVNPPGETIRELLDHNGYTDDEAAKLIGIDSDEFDSVLNGDSELTEKVANGLSSILDMRASYFMGLEKNYKQKLEEINRI